MSKKRHKADDRFDDFPGWIGLLRSDHYDATAGFLEWARDEIKGLRSMLAERKNK